MEKTGIDALACSFGTTYGVYLSEPKLDFSVVEKVRQKANIPVEKDEKEKIARKLWQYSLLF